MKIPNFIVVGAHKAGTTSLHYYLDQHPQIYLPYQKGTDLLQRRKFKELEEAGEYLALFEPAESGQVLGEVSSVYLHNGRELVEKIKHLFPDVKIIAVLRNPIERFYSNALADRAYTQKEIRNFDRLVLDSGKFLIPGLYYTHLQNYFAYFSREQVKLFLYEDFAEHPLPFLAELYSFIGVNPDFVPNMSRRYRFGTLKRANLYRDLLDKGFSMSSSVKFLIPKGIREFIRTRLYQKSRDPKPPMSKELRLALIEYYRDEILNLKQLTGLDVSHWLEMPQN